MKNKKHFYTVDAFVWIRRKDNSGHDKCCTDEVDAIRTVFGLIYHTIRLIKHNDGVIIIKNSPTGK